MTDKNEAIANALELLMINQNGIGAAIEELAKWVAERGSTVITDNAVTALQVLDLNAEGITSAIRLLRQE
jgi:phytoene dehydrogenase-like protein